MDAQDLHGLVQSLREMAHRVLAGRAKLTTLSAADALERLSAQRGTCSSCRFYVSKAYLRNCQSPEVPAVIRIGPNAAKCWGCAEYEPQPTATEEWK